MLGRQELEIPAMFLTVSKARKTLVSRWHLASYVTGAVKDSTGAKTLVVPQVAPWQEQSLSIMARWSSAFDVYLNIRGGHLTKAKRKGTAALRILKELGSTATMLTRTTFDDEMEWDTYCPMFQNVVSLAQDLVELDLEPSAVMPPNCMNMAVVGLLFEVSSLLNPLAFLTDLADIG
jgi:hypothetical protein